MTNILGRIVFCAGAIFILEAYSDEKRNALNPRTFWLSKQEQSYWTKSAQKSRRKSHIGPVPYVDKTAKMWTDWSHWGTCSKTCGSGFQSRTRECHRSITRVMPGSGIRTSHDECFGNNVEYRICGAVRCPPNVVSSASLRAAQCRRHNNQKVMGRVVKNWTPYSRGEINQCSLVCEAEGIVYTFGKVEDSTNCLTEKYENGICVNGICLKIACDGILNGKAEEDMCRVCGGYNDTCWMQQGRSDIAFADQPAIEKNGQHHNNFGVNGIDGYHEVVTISAGATNLRISDNSTKNFIALKKKEKYILNGDWMLNWPGEYDVAGSEFKYSRSEDNSEILTSTGPTNEELVVMVLLRSPEPSVQYEYWTPKTAVKKENTGTGTNSLELKTTAYQNHKSQKLPDKKTLDKFENGNVILEPSEKDTVYLPKWNWSGTLERLEKGKYKSKHRFDIKPFSNSGAKAKIKWKNKKNLSNTEAKNIQLQTTQKTNLKNRRQYKNSTKKLLSAKNAFDNKSSNDVYVNKNLKNCKKQIKNVRKKKRLNLITRKDRAHTRQQKRKSCYARKISKQSFCISDFVVRIDVIKKSRKKALQRIEVSLLYSYKNKIPLLSREFMWRSANLCAKIRNRRSYVVSGKAIKDDRNEVKLMIVDGSYVKKYSNGVHQKMLKYRNQEMKFCKKWRQTSSMK